MARPPPGGCSLGPLGGGAPCPWNPSPDAVDSQDWASGDVLRLVLQRTIPRPLVLPRLVHTPAPGSASVDREARATARGCWRVLARVGVPGGLTLPVEERVSHSRQRRGMELETARFATTPLRHGTGRRQPDRNPTAESTFAESQLGRTQSTLRRLAKPSGWSGPGHRWPISRWNIACGGHCSCRKWPMEARVSSKAASSGTHRDRAEPGLSVSSRPHHRSSNTHQRLDARLIVPLAWSL